MRTASFILLRYIKCIFVLVGELYPLVVDSRIIQRVRVFITLEAIDTAGYVEAVECAGAVFRSLHSRLFLDAATETSPLPLLLTT